MLARRLPTLALFAVATLACASAAPKPAASGPAAAPAPEPSRAPGLMQLWLRGGELLSSPGGPVSADLWNPVTVELLPGGKVRAIDPAGLTVEGYPPELKGDLLTGEARGLGLYAQQDAPIHLSPQGPTIGRVSRGVYLPVAAIDGEWAEVVLRAFVRKPSSGRARELRGFVSLGHLGVKEFPVKAPPRNLREVRDHRRELRFDPNEPGSAFAETRCGRLRVLETRKAAKDGEVLQRIAQEDRGVVIEGWVDHAILDARGDFRCPTRLVNDKELMAFEGAGLPDGFVKKGEGEELAKIWAELVKKERWIFAPVGDGDGVACRAFKLKAKGLELTRDEDREGKKVTLTWRVRPAESRLTVAGPCREKGGKGWCSRSYLMMELRAGRIVLLPTLDSAVARGDFSAYHRDDTEIWFLEREACSLHGGIDHASSVLQ